MRRRTPLAGTDLEPENGWILFFFVDPAHRRGGLGRRLLTDALQWLRGHGRTRVCFAAHAWVEAEATLIGAPHPKGHYRPLISMPPVTRGTKD
ncbi:GNAT family N-acetyltransferase [Streptomyces lydicus]|uniref:GNAT family N-acetyltransferase n=1 Tax=Streptomyces lydicus TaxID=47763 RepID=UPI0037A57018